MKTCPFCAEEIQDAAIVCKHCGRDLPSATTQVEASAQAPKPEPPLSTTDTPKQVPRLALASGRRRQMALAGAIVGFVLTFINVPMSMLGFTLMWISLSMLFVNRLVLRVSVTWLVTTLLWLPGGSASLGREEQREAEQERVAAEAGARQREEAQAQARLDAAAQFPDNEAAVRGQIDELRELAGSEAWEALRTRVTNLRRELAPLFESSIGGSTEVEAIKADLDALQSEAASGMGRLQAQERGRQLEERERRAEANRPRPQLALVSSRGYPEYGYHHVEGQVENVSGVSLEHVTAVVTWYTDDDQFITTHEAIIDYNPILAGQTSPFSTLGSTNPAMSRYSVAFKELLGGTLRVEDRR